VPDTPTLAESGLRGFEVNNWSGILAPAGTPSAVISKLNTEIVRIMQLPEVQARLPKEG
jgi:tripartite-type tricarboxylate transporter receptor subunit TctC